MAKYEIVMGLETHVELATESKIFCSCGGHSSAQEPNDCVCPACAGMPGMLPVMNKHVVEQAVKAGLLLNCHINQYSTFDKKSYYYPDLPAAYQTTQYFHPICVEGAVDVTTSAGTRKIGIKQIHMEEDAGKLVHDDWTNTSMVDFNRTSVPLIEIVTHPDFRSGDEVLAYLNTLKSTFRFMGISECEEGAMRCDVNISIRPEGSTELGVRTEMKNMSSFSAIEKAIKYEIARQMDAIERHTEELVQETRRWDEVKNRTFSMRNKETAADYRYFPDPNVMPIVVDDAWLQEISSSMPASAAAKKEEYLGFGIPEKDVDILVSERCYCDILDGAVALGAAPEAVASWILTECLGILRKNGQVVTTLDVSPAKLARIIALVDGGDITRKSGKKVLEAVIEENVDPDEFVEAKALKATSDQGAIREVVLKSIADNQAAVADYLGGNAKALNAVFGGCMKQLKGNGDPAVIRQILEEEIGKLK